MKLLETVIPTFHRTIVVAQLINLKLSQGVIKIRRIVSAPARFFVCIGGFLKRVLLKELCPLFHGPACSMELDSDDITGVAEQCFLELRQTKLRIDATEAFVEHHPLRVVGPAFSIRAAIK